MYYDKIRLVGLYTVDLPIWGLKASDGYILKGVDGLDPTGVDVFVSPLAQVGGIYQGRRPQSREISLLVGLMPNYAVNQTPSDMRTKLYGLLSPGRNESIEVQLLNGEEGVAKIVGYVKQIAAPPFTSDPAVQIVISCPDAYLSAFETVELMPPGPPTPGTTTFSINNPGSAPAGFSLIFTTNVDLFSVELSRIGSTKTFGFADVDNLKANTLVTIDTRRGSRAVKTRTNMGATKSILGSVYNDANTEWFQLYPGLNQFSIRLNDGSKGGATNWVWNSVFFLPQYEGV